MTLKKQLKINGQSEKFTLSEDGTKLFYVDRKTNNIWAIELDNNYDCLFTDEYILPDVDSNKWVASDKEYKCYTKFDNSKYIFLKKNNKM